MGGHLTQMMLLKDAFRGHTTFTVTYQSDVTGELENTYVLPHYGERSRIILTLVSAFIGAIHILLREKPNIIVTTGSEIAIPFAYLGKMLGMKVIFVDTLTRVKTKSFTGMAVYPIADLFLVQWPEMTSRYGAKAICAGRIL